MNQPQSPDLSSLSSQFQGLAENLTHEWGFFVVRTAYTADVDKESWTAALENLHRYVKAGDDAAEIHPSTLALPVIADRSALNGIDYASIRNAFTGWLGEFLHHKRPLDDDGNEDWPSDVRRDVFIVIDDPSLASLLNAPEPVRGRSPNLDPEPWVIVVDSEDPDTVPYRGGGPYMGFMRARACALGQLFEDLGSRSMGRVCPVREYEGQIPLYDGSLRGKLIDGDFAAGARYRFPRGTPRGADGAMKPTFGASSGRHPQAG
ncbi:hypothetical protein CDEST_03732 [Colletotrichum destructivum]|uniref:Uncharacterized protein n=1 Tax=Colletotrichum destructivum TaxID=34406 RepID=A0AAX4I723_9PEZI|nr:hypothetical protein CDEST_03732 [Colletotrichum destructivum]